MKKLTSQRLRIGGRLVLFAILLLGGMAILTPKAANAAGDLNSAINKSKYEALYNCYQNNQMVTPITSKNWEGWYSLAYFSSTFPIYNSDGSTASYVSCGELIRDNFTSKIPSESASVSDLTTFFRNMSYTVSDAEGDGVCATYNFTKNDGGKSYVQMCAPDVSGGTKAGVINSSKMEITYSDGIAEAVEFKSKNKKVELDCKITYWFGGIGRGGCQTHSFEPGATTFSALADAIYSDIANAIASKGGAISRDKWYFDGDIAYSPYGSSNRTFSIGNTTTAANGAIKHFSGGTYRNHSDLRLSNDEKIALLLNDLNNFYHMSYYLGSESSACNLTGDALSRAEAATEYTKINLSPSKTCFITSTTNRNSDVAAYNTSSGYPDGTRLSFSGVVEELNKLVKNNATTNPDVDISEDLNPTAPGETPGTNTGGDSGESGGESSSITACYENAGVLGWIACPVLEVVGGMVEGLYDYVENNFLEVKTSLVQSSGVQSGWGIFRDFANIVFVIVFILIILSQVTGIGVSNYGIKKTLPRLIMVVVLVNVSLVLCELAVDVSNILGSSLRGMFEGFAKTAASEAGGVPFDLGTVAGGILGSLFATGTAVAVTAVFAFTIPWELWLFPILLTFIGCLVSIFFFFIILGVRQAGVIILITLAPIAIVCYALPNTKSFFDRWKKLFAALLLVYPICGILMGGGQFASTLLLVAAHETGDAGGFFTIVAMLLQVVPFFMIPGILRSSMAMMGNLGMKIANMGSRIGGGITRGIRNSEMGRDIQRGANMRYLDRSARKIEGQQGTLRGKVLGNWKNKRLGRYNTAYNRYSFEDIRAGGAASRIKPGSDEYKSLLEGQQSDQFAKDVAGRQELFKGGKVKRITGGATNDYVNGNDDAMLEAEFSEYLDRIIAGTGTAEEQDTYVKSAQAIANILSDRGTGSARTRVINSLSSAVSRNEPTLSAAMGNTDAAKANRQRLARSIGSIAGSLNSKFGKAYKGDNPEAVKLLGDLAQADFSRAGSFSRVVQDRDIDGNITGTHLRSTAYAGAGLDGMSVEDFSKLKTSGLSNILDGIKTGDIKGAKLQEAARLADEVLSSDVYTPDADARRYMEQVRDAAFASTYMAGGATRAAGSRAIGSASSAAIDSIVSQLQSSGAWSSLSSDQQQHLSGLVGNIQDSLANDSFTAGDASQLQQALRIAHNKSVEVGGQVVSATPATPPQLKIDRNAPQAQVKAAVPQGWTETGIWVGGGAGPTRQQQIAYEEWAKHSAEVDRHNSSLGGSAP